MSDPATVLKTSHTKGGSTHYYGAKLRITVDPGDPPEIPPETVDITFEEIDPEFYADLRAAILAGKSVEVDWSEILPATNPRTGTLTGVHISA